MSENTKCSTQGLLSQKGNKFWVPKKVYQEHSGNTLLMNTGIVHFCFSPSGNNLCLSQRDTAHLIIITNLVAFSLSIPLRLKIWKYRELKHKCHFSRIPKHLTASFVSRCQRQKPWLHHSSQKSVS